MPSPANARCDTPGATDSDCDIAVIGGGFYGCAIASYLARRKRRVTLIERERELLQRASLVNQARLHNGYHYPRSYRTALRSRVNLAVFREIFPESVFDRFRALYAIAEFNSNVSTSHFERFCRQVGIGLQAASKADQALFDRRLVRQVFEVDEPAFDVRKLRERMTADLAALPIELIKNHAVTQITARDHAPSHVEMDNGRRIRAAWVLNCTYAELGHIPCRPSLTRPLGLIYQIAEVAVIRPPPVLAGTGITIMDGPFFSTMPFPPSGAHSLTHVRYTHHLRWQEGEAAGGADAGSTPTSVLERYLAARGGPMAATRFAYMIRDARRFVPALNAAEHLDSHFAVKTLLNQTQVDDARPILFQRDTANPRLISILGGKIDNIFDVFAFLDATLDLPPLSKPATMHYQV